MKPEEITVLLERNYSQLHDWALSVGKSRWEGGPENKWTAGQHILHLVQSTKPLLNGIKIPAFLLKMKFGSCNRPPRNYDTVVQRYHEKLNQSSNIISPFSSNMPAVPVAERRDVLDQLNQLNLSLNKRSLKLRKNNLDRVVLPHPLMGKMTLREILMWNAYHTEHHLRQLMTNY